MPSTNMQLYTNASGNHGWGAYWSGKWLQIQWSEAQLQMDITWKELFAIVMAVHTYLGNTLTEVKDLNSL